MYFDYLAILHFTNSCSYISILVASYNGGCDLHVAKHLKEDSRGFSRKAIVLSCNHNVLFSSLGY